MRTKLHLRAIVIIVLELTLFFMCLLTILKVPAGLVTLIFLLYDIRSRTYTVIVSKENIVVKNWFTTEKRIFTYDDFDQVVVHYDSFEAFARHNFFLLKDGVIFCKVAGRNFVNFEELLIEIKRNKSRSILI